MKKNDVKSKTYWEEQQVFKRKCNCEFCDMHECKPFPFKLINFDELHKLSLSQFKAKINAMNVYDGCKSKCETNTNLLKEYKVYYEWMKDQYRLYKGLEQKVSVEEMDRKYPEMNKSVIFTKDDRPTLKKIKKKIEAILNAIGEKK